MIVPGGTSIACSTAKAIEWYASWLKNLISDRATLRVHVFTYDKPKTSISIGGMIQE